MQKKLQILADDEQMVKPFVHDLKIRNPFTCLRRGHSESHLHFLGGPRRSWAEADSDQVFIAVGDAWNKRHTASPAFARL